MAPQMNLGANYEDILSVWVNLNSATDNELLNCVRSQCDPLSIAKAGIENGGNQVGVLGLIIEEIGRRKIRDAAPIIVEYTAWPFHDDFWTHLVPRCFKALSEIGDGSIIGRMLQLTSADVAATKAVAALRLVSPRIYSTELEEQFRPDPDQDAHARIIMIAIAEGLASVERIKAWANSAINSATQPPPVWLCDLAMQGGFDMRRAPEKPDLVFSFDERAICIIAFHRLGAVPLAVTFDNVFRYDLDGYFVGKKALFAILEAQTFRENNQIKRIRADLHESYEDILVRRPLLESMVSILLAQHSS